MSVPEGRLCPQGYHFKETWIVLPDNLNCHLNKKQWLVKTCFYEFGRWWEERSILFRTGLHFSATVILVASSYFVSLPGFTLGSGLLVVCLIGKGAGYLTPKNSFARICFEYEKYFKDYEEKWTAFLNAIKFETYTKKIAEACQKQLDFIGPRDDFDTAFEEKKNKLHAAFSNVYDEDFFGGYLALFNSVKTHVHLIHEKLGYCKNEPSELKLELFKSSQKSLCEYLNGAREFPGLLFHIQRLRENIKALRENL